MQFRIFVILRYKFLFDFVVLQFVIMDEFYVILDEIGFFEVDFNVIFNDISMYYKQIFLVCYLLSRKGKVNLSLNIVEMNLIFDL